MKTYLLVLGLVAGLAVANGAVQGDSCSTNSDKCTALFSGFSHIEKDMHKYTKQMLVKSYDFLLLSSVFDHYKMDRPGFEKLYRKIADKAWEDTIDLIKYQSRRGAVVTLDETSGKFTHNVSSLLTSDESSSLKLALDYEKLLATEAHIMHKKISHTGESNHYDPDVAHYLDENFIEYQSGTIRKLSGHITNLNDILGEAGTKDLGLQMFDDYLDKVE